MLSLSDPSLASPENPPLDLAYRLLLKDGGHQAWWPGDSPLEICLGAILTQNTSWTNVEKALALLKESPGLQVKALLEIPMDQLASRLRPVGYFNLKARRLRSFLSVVAHEYGGKVQDLLAGSTSKVRERLLAISGIGPETADSMLLYAGMQPSFVVDAYTRRVFARHGWTAPDADYNELQALCVQALPWKPESPGDSLDLWQDFHAHIVRLGKDYCRPRNPRCTTCPLQPLLTAPSGALPT